MPTIADIQKFVFTLISSNPTINSAFSHIYSSPSPEPINPDTLIVDLIDIKEVKFYGYFEVGFVFIIITSSRSKALQLFDILLQQLNIKTFINSERTLSVYFQYNGTYDEILDTTANLIYINSLWNVRATFLTND
jgi:hypothetical protein